MKFVPLRSSKPFLFTSQEIQYWENLYMDREDSFESGLPY